MSYMIIDDCRPGALGRIYSVRFLHWIKSADSTKRDVSTHLLYFSCFAVAIGVCSSDGCECGEPHGPLCGCPHCDCSRSGPQPPFCHKICLTGCNSTSTSSSSSGANSYENVADAEDTTENKGEGQTPSIRQNWWMALAAAAGVAAAGFGVVAWRKRVCRGLWTISIRVVNRIIF